MRPGGRTRRRKGGGAALPAEARLRFPADRIRRRVDLLARRIAAAHPDGVVLVGVLNGGAFLLADLARRIPIPVRIDFLRLRSYGDGTSPGDAAEITKDIETDVAGLDVVVVEDIVDTGRSLHYLRRHFAAKEARTVRFCALIDKRERREVEVTIEYPGFRLDRGFIVGYGMDLAGAHRHLPDIWVLPGPKPEYQSPEGSE